MVHNCIHLYIHTQNNTIDIYIYTPLRVVCADRPSPLPARGDGSIYTAVLVLYRR